jgi:ribosome maturation factor RimP
MNRTSIVAKIEEIAERVAQPEGIEIVEVDLKGAGRHQVLRIVIDRLAGVTHNDCEFVSQQVGAILDVEDTIHGAYSLEVSSPGVERKLTKWKDWERFTGKKVKVVLREPISLGKAASAGQEQAQEPAGAKNPLKYFEGIIAQAQNQTVTVKLPDDLEVTFPVEQVDRAHLRFEW